MIDKQKYISMGFLHLHKEAILWVSVLLFASLFLSSCSNTKFLKDDETLYTWTWFKWKGKKNVENLPYKAYDVFTTGYVKTNWNFFTFSRSGLTAYNYLMPKGNWGLRHYMWEVLSKPPVLLEEVNPEARRLKIKQSLFDRGHFDSEVTLKLKYNKRDPKKVQGIYIINLKPSYHYNSYRYFPAGNSFDSYLLSKMDNSFIVPGKEYWIADLKSERQRVTDLLRNKGYFFMSPSYFIFNMDTTIGNKKIDAYMHLKKNIPEYKKEVYSISKVRIFWNTSKDSIQNIPLTYDSINHVWFQKQQFYKQKYINRKISLLDTNIFKLDNHNNTLSLIAGFGMFRRTELIYNIDSTKENALIANLFLSPVKPVTISVEMNFATKSNDFLGPSAILSFSHFNVFGGGEHLSLQIDGGFEWQKRSKRQKYELGLNSFELGTKAVLEFPRFLMPVHIKRKSKKYLPKTYIIAGYRAEKRVKYYRIDIASSNFGYKWKADNSWEYKIEPLSLNYIYTRSKSKEFDDYLNKYPSIARSFDEQFILGGTYNLTTQRTKDKESFKNYYNSLTIDIAGNLPGLFANMTDTPDKLFGKEYSQFFKITNDARYHLHISPVKELVFRFLAGIGIPYNHSSVLPYIKQYFAGGSNDIRAFYARTLGPGSYKKDYTNNDLMLDQSGEIKIMGNMEYRFPIFYKLNGAVFMDAGNVWLLKEDSSRVGGKFNFNSFYKEIAVGFGLGLRVDLDYVVLRLDAALPFRNPYKEYGSYWTFSSPYFFKNYILSLAIGYPF